MTAGPAWRRYLTFWRTSVDRDVDAELRFHFEERVADLMARGSTLADARAQAVQEFGDPGEYRARLREIDQRVQARRGRREWLDVVAADIRYSLRAMARAPGLTATVIVTLALGIGANGAIFSLLDRIFLRPPPAVADAGELRRFYGEFKAPPPQPAFVRQVFGYAEFMSVRDALGSRQPLIAYRSVVARLGTAEDSPKGQVVDAFGDYFGLLGVRAWRGRTFSAGEADGSGHAIVVLSHRFWTRQLGADTGIVGGQIQIGRRTFVVIGIAPPGFDGLDLDAADIWRPASAQEPWYQAGTASLRIVTRLAPEEDARAVTQTANNGLHRPEDRLARSTALTLGSIIAGRGPADQLKESAIATRLAGVTLIVLLIAVANAANLLLTRAIQRRREISIRIALGISRQRLAALLATESAVLALIAGGVALLVATWGAILIRTLLLPDVRWAGGPFDLRLATYTFAVALLAGGLTGVLPFARTGRFDLAASMRGGARDGGAHRSRMRGALIVVQAALSVVLLAGAMLFVRSLRAVQALDLGYDRVGVIMASVASGQRIIPSQEREAGLQAVRERVARIPGVRDAALSNISPMGGLSITELHFPGRDSLPRTAGGSPTFTAVSPEYFNAAGVAIVAGRAFTPGDRDGSQSVMVVTRTMARFIWGAQNPLGACVRVGPITAPCTIVVGVSEDVRRGQIIEGEMLQFYLPMAQAPKMFRGGSSLVVGVKPTDVAAVRQEIRAIVMQQFPGSRPEIVTLAEKLDPQYRPWRIGASLFTVFGVLALLVASIGVYSAVAHAVTQRTHELGVRLALGAQRFDVGRMVVGSGVRLVGGGVLIGVAASLALGRFVESLLFGTSARDPIVLTGVSVILLAVAILAGALPAWRASTLDPVQALRAE